MDHAFDLVIRGWPIRLVRDRDLVLLWATGASVSVSGDKGAGGGRPYLFGFVSLGVGEVVTTAAPPQRVLDDCLHLARLLAPRAPSGPPKLHVRSW